MIRKTLLALTATAALAGAAMIPTTASAAHGHGHGWGVGGFGISIGGPVVGSCWQYQYIETRRGLRRMLVNVCN